MFRNVYIFIHKFTPLSLFLCIFVFLFSYFKGFKETPTATVWTLLVNKIGQLVRKKTKSQLKNLSVTYQQDESSQELSHALSHQGIPHSHKTSVQHYLS